MDEQLSPAEKAFVERYLSRQMLRARQTVIEARYMDANLERGSNAEPVTEADIEMEAPRHAGGRADGAVCLEINVFFADLKDSAPQASSD